MSNNTSEWRRMTGKEWMAIWTGMLETFKEPLYFSGSVASVQDKAFPDCKEKINDMLEINIIITDECNISPATNFPPLTCKTEGAIKYIAMQTDQMHREYLNEKLNIKKRKDMLNKTLMNDHFNKLSESCNNGALIIKALDKGLRKSPIITKVTRHKKPYYRQNERW